MDDQHGTNYDVPNETGEGGAGYKKGKQLSFSYRVRETNITEEEKRRVPRKLFHFGKRTLLIKGQKIGSIPAGGGESKGR